MMGDHLIKGWAKTQTLVALSSGESELYATFRAASEGLRIQSAAKDQGKELHGEVQVVQDREYVDECLANIIANLDLFGKTVADTIA